jgi:DNA-binding transcriptional regulator YbjK
VVDRRAVLLDAALEIVGTQGMRALTHRAVDGQAGLPMGSTSNLFRTREALLIGLGERFVERERSMAEGGRGGIEPSAQGIAEALGRFAVLATTSERVVTLTRYALLVEAAQHPELAGVLVDGADRVDTWALDVVSRAGSQAPARDHDVLANFVTGMVLHQLALPSPDFDPTGRIAALVATLDWRLP